jgi:hypothetical protein
MSDGAILLTYIIAAAVAFTVASIMMKKGS